MRNFKIVIITLLLVVLALGILSGVKAIIPASGPDQIDYHEDNESAEDDLYSRKLKQAEGTVKVLGISIYQEGTHRLEKDDKLVMILESDKFNLDEVIDKIVKVTGFVRDTAEGGQKIMSVMNLELVMESGIKAFQEVEYDFSFSYPSDWQPKKSTDQVTFLANINTEMVPIMSVTQRKNIDVPLEIWLKTNAKKGAGEDSKIKVGDLTGLRRTFKEPDAELIATYVKKDLDLFEIKLLRSDEAIKGQYFSIVDFFKVTTAKTTEDKTAEEKKPDEVRTEAETETKMTEDQNPAEEKPSTTTSTPTTSTTTYSGLTPLTADQVTKVIDKGFLPFTGRVYSFSYPKIWYFGNLGGSKYGFTDDQTYKANQEVTLETSRIVIFPGDENIQCSAKETATLGQVNYTVCAREPGLEKLISKIAESVK